MSTRCTVLYGGPFHLFEESNDDFKLTLSISAKKNEYSGGVYLRKEDLVQFAKQILHYDLTGKELEWVYPKEDGGE